MKQLVIFIFVLITTAGFAQSGSTESLLTTDKQFVNNIKEFQTELNKEFADTAHSPLTKADLLSFRRLDFFPIDLKYCVKAKFVKTQESLPFGMPTTTDRLPEYIKYGTLYFTIDSQDLQLALYQNIELVKKEEYKNYLFLPFGDKTNGESSYGGGRYIDMQIPKTDEVIIDFNKSYNPYCAYNHRYSCPRIPSENILNVKIKAGVKAFKK